MNMKISVDGYEVGACTTIPATTNMYATTFTLPNVRPVSFPTFNTMSSSFVVQPMTTTTSSIFTYDMDGYYSEWTKLSLTSELRSCNTDVEMRKRFVEIIRRKQSDILREIVVEKFDKYLPMLDKLLVLK